MMKIWASSPGRPLMRFVKGNVHSRSGRGRPLFFRKKIAAVETQEPSSPKVTCMGQVRVRRNPTTRRRCKWALFCTGTPTPTCRPHWRTCLAYFQPHRRKKVQIGRQIELERVKSKQQEEEEKDQNDDVATSSNTPPRNAFLLTRSRSAPYRSSSLASRFWGSEDSHEPTSENEPFRRDSEQESRTRPQTEEKSEEKEGCSIREATVKSEGGGGGSVQPSLLLTRSKSEPARTAAAKLGKDTNFWKLTRFADADSGS